MAACAAMTDPMLVPPTMSMGIPASLHARITPIWANPLAAPPPKAITMEGGFLLNPRFSLAPKNSHGGTIFPAYSWLSLGNKRKINSLRFFFVQTGRFFGQRLRL
jgi:hypothetical protein